MNTRKLSVSVKPAFWTLFTCMLFVIFGAGQVKAGIVASGKCGDNVYYTISDSGKAVISGTGDTWNYEYNSEENESPFFEYEYYQSEINEIEVEAGVTRIGDCLFCGCTSLREVTIGSGIERIGARAFERCSDLAFIEIPDTVANIDYAAFAMCWQLAGIYVPSSYTEFGEEVFRETTTKLTIYGKLFSKAQNYADANGITFKAVDGKCGEDVYWSLDQNGVLDIFGSGPMYDYTIPIPPRIPGSPFAGNADITKVNILNGVTRVGDLSFIGCTGITGWSQPNLPGSLKEIGKNAFRACTSITDLYIPEGTERIEDNAFSGCTALEYAYFAGTQENPMVFGTNIYDKTDNFVVYARLDTTAVQDAIARGIKVYLIDSFEYIDLDIPYQVTVIEEEAFSGTAATHISMGEEVTAINSRAFADSPNLEKIFIPDTCTSIASDAFEGCPSGLMIYCHEDTCAETFAREHGYYVAVAPRG